ncbi:uncharacterized protein LOC110029552 [Phalaenopsis equestris]|uniref:uncharacterized protein LOC110029552 n=1 Tax=Phalaenopsis equestris TaxID=78828 RepID=UPI0009E1DA1C|nr:uncharacterized protein LOC110029552 [Phalaenopsis equestris]
MTEVDSLEISNFKRKLEVEFDIKELGKMKNFLGMEFATSKDGIFVNQSNYVLDLLKETGLTGCKAADTPIEPNVKLKTAATNEVMDKAHYQRLVGRLIYLVHTRLVIAFAVSVVSQFMHSPEPTHFEAVFRILRYLKRTPGKAILFKKGEHLMIEAYTDADWAVDVNDRRFTSSYCTFVDENLVT